MFAIIITLLFAGTIAGLIQYFVVRGLKFDEPPVENIQDSSSANWLVIIWNFITKHWEFFAYIIVGIGGAFLVPVINELTTESLPGLANVKTYTACLSKAANTGEDGNCTCDPWYFMVLLGYGIIFGYSAVRIIKGIGTLLLGNVTRTQKDQQKKLEEADQKIKDLSLALEELKAKLPKKAGSIAVNAPEMAELISNDYFNELQNEKDKRSYYAGIDFDDQGSLFSDLNSLLVNTHKLKLSYKPALHLYPVVDRYHDGLLRSIYSGKTFDLETLLEMDALVDIARMEAVANLSFSNISSEDYESRLEKIENELPYNCEHVVPQSWFGKKEPMKGDLHHLFTCEEKCNNFRAAYKYFDFDDYGDNTLNVIKDDCGKLENRLFEPEINKGMAARAVLYFLLRYPATVTMGGYTADDIKMLIRWNNANKVSKYELHRNYFIYVKQGNRNPFIDWPELADKIDFSTVLNHEYDDASTPNNGDDEVAINEMALSGMNEIAAAGCDEFPKPWNEKPWRPAESLKVLRSQINLLAPGRKKGSDGMIGDLAHQSRSSDHNPWVWDRAANKGIVTAFDITHDPIGKCDCNILAASLQTNKDPRIKYVIWNRRIMNSSPINGSNAWDWRSYNGTNPHNKHIHVSVKCDKDICDSTRQWVIKTS